MQELKDKIAYTIIRPGGLKSEPGTGNGVLTEDTSVCGAIHREDVASLLVQALFSSAADNKVCVLLMLVWPHRWRQAIYFDRSHSISMQGVSILNGLMPGCTLAKCGLIVG